MKGGEPLAKQHLAILLRTCAWIPALRLLSGPAATRLARTNGFREAWNEVGQSGLLNVNESRLRLRLSVA